MSLSVVILTKDEEKNIRACIEHLAWSDEIIVVDSGSGDATVEIATEMGARVLVNEVKPFLISEQRNWALDHGGIQSEWVLFIDADEIVTDALKEEVLATTASASENVVGYQLCFKLMFMGRWLKHTVGFPSWHDRLLRLGRVRFKGGVWESFDAKDSVQRLREPYLHYAFSNGMDAWIDRHQRYAAWKAQELMNSKERPLRELVGRTLRGDKRCFARLAERILGYCPSVGPFFRFSYYYIFRLGFLDGRAGLTYSRMMAMFQFMIFLQIAEQRMREAGHTL